MKILAIRGKNLASLEGEFEINFTNEPLKSAGIFAITGQTGAGKSTILDALCLALFDDAPRLNKAESSVSINDVEDKTITQKDSRNILRRGTSDGYAEVDFIALNGNKYRSRWMVRRSRGRADGALQPTSVNLYNLSSGTEEQGTKKDLLYRITEIIGLTFDQFTRAVLLAQGDFANFLKAKQSEKAELLEKLTGTEVYSKISVTIFQKTSEAKNELDLSLQRIKDIKLLTKEELDAFTLEKTTLENEIIPLNKLISVLDKKLNWIKQEGQLKEEIIQAENELCIIQAKIKDAFSRYEYMSMIDVSQEIRDLYLDLLNRQNQYNLLTVNLQTRECELNSVLGKFEEIDKELTLTKTILNEIELKYNILKPEILKSRELDLKIQSVREKHEESNKELNIFREQLNRSEQNILKLKSQELTIKQEIERLTKWFAENDNYKNVVSNIDRIVTFLNSAKTVKVQEINALRGLESSNAILTTYNLQLKQQKEEAERLDQLLPAEILNLRNKLEDGKPCPVCGSCHHPLQEKADQKDGINDKELELAKSSIADAIIKTKEYLDATYRGITEFEIHINNFQDQYETIYKDIKGYLQGFPDWEFKFKEEKLQNELVFFSTQWNENRIQLDNYSQQSENYAVRLEAEIKMSFSISENLRQKEEAVKSQTELLNELIRQRIVLLENKSVEVIERNYLSQKEEWAKKYEYLRSEKERAGADKAVVTGSIDQLKKEIEINTNKLIELNTIVSNWIEHNEHQITFELLKDLMSKPREWINVEKEYLSGLRNQELIFRTTLSERNNRLVKHQESEDKPDSDQSKDILSQLQLDVSEKSIKIKKRLTEIEILLATHYNGKEQISSYEKDLNGKTQLYSDWAKLNDMFGSATGNKFKTIAQGYTLDVLLGYANKHLEELTKRYKLEKIPDTLALQVIDNDMLGEIRTVHSLSGGESFLISLALALGLSSLSSNRMKIESLFIDEGFGALDIDTLSIAMDALDNLQTQGRKIGVISHVEEMKERITTQIQVVRAANGRSVIKITN